MNTSLDFAAQLQHFEVATESGITPQLRVEEPEPGLLLVHLRLDDGGRAFEIPRFTWKFETPIVDVHGVWHPNAYRDTTANLPRWNTAFEAQATAGAPIFSLFNHADANRLTAALSDAAREVSAEIRLSEEKAALLVSLERFHKGQRETVTAYEETLRLDLRPHGWTRAVQDVGAWWAAQPDKTPAPAPPSAREAVLSTWYAMHQQVSPERIERECALARDYHCRVVIVDDGWQTSDNGRGYGFCGDWEIDQGKMPGYPPERVMAAHVGRVQALGLRYVLWIAPLWMGDFMNNKARFASKFLYRRDSLKGDILDPRFPDVRDYLVETFVRLMRELNLDGFKIDFVDLVGRTPSDMVGRTGEGRDVDSIPVAMDLLLVEMTQAFRSFKPDFLVEFRQSYVGPLMRKYGNMFRAGDCPNDFERNRACICNLRLLCGDTPAHADMFLWHPDESPPNAARQMLASLFGVPQISVALETIAPAQAQTLKHWLLFWTRHRDVLLGGEFTPLRPQAGFPVILARDPQTQIAAVYDDAIVPLDKTPPRELLVVNAAYKPRVALDCDGDFGTRWVEFFDLNGEAVGEGEVALNGLQSLAVPVCGYARLW